MTHATVFPLEGGCDCGEVRSRLTTRPPIVHCCHCRGRQRESGAAFALNARIESERVVHLRAAPEWGHTPSLSGAGQRIARGRLCRGAVLRAERALERRAPRAPPGLSAAAARRSSRPRRRGCPQPAERSDLSLFFAISIWAYPPRRERSRSSATFPQRRCSCLKR